MRSWKCFLLLFSRNFYFLLVLRSVFTSEKRLSVVLFKKIKYCLFIAIFLSWTNVIRFSTNEVPLRRIKYQWFCTALLNLELLNYSTLWQNEENHLNYLCFSRSSPHFSTNGVSSFSGKTRPSVIQGTVEVLTSLMQELQNSGKTDSELWKNCEVSSFVLFLEFLK